jgi:hypothetical protein
MDERPHILLGLTRTDKMTRVFVIGDIVIKWVVAVLALAGTFVHLAYNKLN